MVFSNVLAAAHDRQAGFIPAYVRHDTVMVRTMQDKCRARAIGASLSMRTATFEDIGGFDGALGAGGTFPSCEDGDAAVRSILRGWWVCETDATEVVHFGFRTWAEGKALTRRDWTGIGAAYANPPRRASGSSS